MISAILYVIRSLILSLLLAVLAAFLILWAIDAYFGSLGLPEDWWMERSNDGMYRVHMGTNGVSGTSRDKTYAIERAWYDYNAQKQGRRTWGNPVE